MQILLNGKPHELASETTVSSLIESLDLRAELVAIEVNEGLVPRATRGERVLAEGDRVEIVTLVGGG